MGPVIRTVLLFCYGNFDPDLRSRAEIEGYEQYLLEALKVVEEVDPTLIVICGGKTHPLASESEAASVYRAFGDRFPEATAVELEEDSVNTAQNLELGLQAADEFYLGDDTLEEGVLVICDRYRWPKVTALSLRYRTAIDVKSVPRPDPHPNSSWRKQIPEALRYLFRSRDRLLSAN